MKTAAHLAIAPLLCQLLLAGTAVAQGGSGNTMPAASIARLPTAVLDITPPAARISGTPGTMHIIDRSCPTLASGTNLRQHIVDTVVQEWAFFGLRITDQRGTAPVPGQQTTRRSRRFGPLNPDEVAHVAASVAGYWAAAPGSDWILARQNERWNGPNGLASRYSDPWSAAFISWVMCESGLGDMQQFRRAIAHHSYIDQAIRARDGQAPDAVYIAYDPGEQAINPGDMLCNGLRPAYRNLAQRRKQLGEGARTHCDIVVQINDQAGLLLTIGGNVRSAVRMKIFPLGNRGTPAPTPLPTARTIFAHLQLQAPTIAADALQRSATLTSLACTLPNTPATFADAQITLSSAHC